MKTHFLVKFPHARGYAKHVLVESGTRHRDQATQDERRGKQVLLSLTREQFDSVSRRNGSLSITTNQFREAIADVDFEAFDGTLHKTAEDCLEHELLCRFGVRDLDSLEAVLAGKTEHVEEPVVVSLQDAIRLVESSLKTKGRRPVDIQRDTGLDEQTVYNILSQNPHVFKVGRGGYYSRVNAEPEQEEAA